MTRFQDLSEKEILALAISLEEEDERVYADIAAKLLPDFEASSKVFKEMQQEESEHRRQLIDLFKKKFGDHIPLIRKQDIKGFASRKPVWMSSTMNLGAIRREVADTELQMRKFYEQASARSPDPDIRALLDDLAMAERDHESKALELSERSEKDGSKKQEDDASHRLFVMQIIQPGLAGLMDGSVSTLAPVFAAAAASQNTHYAFLVGLAASIGAGISMGFAEALSDDGVLTGRGHPVIRGVSCGLMTGIGGIGHTLPFLIKSFHVAMAIALIVVVIELAIITWVRHRFMETPILSAAMQVAFGGALVFATGLLIGSS